ncbi:MAG: TIGR00269 family protein [Methanobacteriaceae archaeon]|jgi:uncharacterized protein (TIGR00269 family)|nr:TIGR00269 family protein [Candidatus Methanorudis spinitermitis]
MSSLNKKEFNEKLFSRIEKLIEDYKLVEKNDSIAIALSGGKDSVLTLHTLANYQKSGKFDFDLVAISVDEGIKGYREDGITSAVNNVKKLDIELIQKSFKEELKFTLDDSYYHFKSACIPCGVFRRNILNKTAYSIGANKIATGHNLDDEIQSFLMSFARADTLKFSKFGPKLDQIGPKLIPRIKPLWNTPEKDVGTWAIINNINVHLDECPYANLSLRSKTKNFLNNIESKYPKSKLAIMESFKKSLNIKAPIANLNECEKCGEPSSANVCKACELLNIINSA